MPPPLRLRVAVWGLVASACNVEPVGVPTGGVTVIRQPGCPAAAIVVMSDFVSTQVAISALDGETLSASFVSTASASVSGLAFPLSGDVSVPSTRPPSGRVVLVDRFGTNVVTWLDPETARVLAQLPVGTGFQSNPHDYLELDERRALVSRWEENPAPGLEPFDAGGDLLVLDTLRPDITSSIELPRDGGIPPRPGAVTRVGAVAVVTLERVARDFRSAGDAMLVGVDPTSERIAWSLTLPGLKNCGGLTLAPSGRRAVLGCTGFIDRDGRAEDLAQSALVLFDATQSPPVPLERFSASDLAGEPIQSDVEFFSENGVLVKTQTTLGGSRNNRLLAFELDSERVVTLAEAGGSAGDGKGIVYGGLLCTPGCGNVCLLADADRAVLARFAIANGALEALPSIRVEDEVGLPPRGLGSY
ncbi:MAG TPA: hypothetical protein VMS65_06415 [Polyangiaceae bacterium]|nr:hypothetical protein [Polyangiaceae bacterium]